jgi:phytoene synthase
MQDAFAYCAELVRAADRDRFIASLFAPAGRRNALHALYAFDIEIARVREVAHAALPGEIRLQWWSDALRGERAGEAAANPVAAALIETVRRHELSVETLAAAVEAHGFDLYDEPMATVDELKSYIAKTCAAPLSLAVQILGGGDGAGDVIQPAGLIIAIARLLRTFPQHVARRQLFVAVETLSRHGIAAESVFAGENTPGLRAALGELRDLATESLIAASRHIAAVPSAALPALLPVAVARLVLDRMKALDYDPFAPPEIQPWRRQWVIWRAARNAKRITG